ncbi:alpha/beta hydrolase [Actinoplanes couchii]|uniref:Peptidase S33 tripeptidyl aminopeptidase-like C-terminal domain-containing protein n=1 Tax=Actinoplanes couchii TaxID=403638 RepID=A0ABQ3X903_9ACTN|nr:alpha/beta hydrolase [Actinoplanes couchii]MDR6325850.1 hypothetical protein [Actinoplanes couchii]GID54982.1 hypothetical protein Aco03nite_033860 [Actinoplanes couchii]
MKSADGATKALWEILKRCDVAGEEYCSFAAGNPITNFKSVAAKLRAKPLVIEDETGTFTLTYADFVGGLLSYMYSPYAGEVVTSLISEVAAMQAGGAAAASAKVALRKRYDAGRKAGYDFPYDNSFEAQSAVICTDGKHPKNASGWPAYTAARDLQAPYFGRVWGWLSVQCASKTWTVRDEDAYRGPFNKRTKAPVLIVGNYWDPATNYAASVSASKLTPNSRLLTSDNWGHTAYGTGACATGAIDRYLLTGKVPAAGTKCKADHQPFTEPLSAGEEPDPGADLSTMSAATPGKKLPPVVAPQPVSVLTGTR